MTQKTRLYRRLVQSRTALAFLITIFLGVLILGRLAYLQVLQGGYWASKAVDQRAAPIPVLARRGDILDRNGEVLVTSIPSDAIYAHPGVIREPETIAARLAPVLGVSVADLLPLLQQHRSTVWVKLRVDPKTSQKVRQLRLPGIGIDERPQRFYPNGQMASQILGFTGIDNQGLEGLEYRYEDVLAGKAGSRLVERDARGVEMPEGEHRFTPAEPGHSLVLTIDRTVQYFAERALSEALEKTRSDWGLVVLIKPQTGEILASALQPSYDPDHYDRFPVANRRDRLVSDLYEPGSTFKVVTAAAALQTKSVELNDHFVDPVRLSIGGGTVTCWAAPEGHGDQTFVQALENSCNPVFAQVAVERIGPKPFYDIVQRFGFGDQLGVDLPGEAQGIVPDPNRMRGGKVLQWANIGFGQGISVTPLQLLSAVGAIANGGRLMKPYIVSEIKDNEGIVESRTEPAMIRQVVDEDVAHTVARMMRSVVKNGTGSNAEIPGYRPAGKTGTAEVPEKGGYSSTKRVVSFVGFAPYDDPVVAGLVVLYNPKEAPKYGGVWAAPVFKGVIDKVLTHYKVPREVENVPSREPERHQNPQPVIVPNLQGMSRAEATKALYVLGLRAAFEGKGTQITSQSPAAGEKVLPGTGTDITLSLIPSAAFSELKVDTVVPEVVGLGIREAMDVLDSRGLRLEFQGSGRALKQTPVAGTRVPNGTPVYVEFAPPQ